jgi:predicted lipoprotein with Yx(FWY)xxD motif
MTAPLNKGGRGPRAVRRLAVAVAALGSLALGVAVGTSGASAAKAVVISARPTTTFGTILVSGRTLYTLTPTGAGCDAACLRYWPEVLLPKGVTHAVAGHGVDAARLGTLKRPKGRLQVTYRGRALYWFALDAAPGQVKGNVTDTWGTWSVVVLKKPAPVGVTTTTSARPGATTTTSPSTTTSKPPTTTTSHPPTTTTTKPPTTTTTSGGGGGIGF